MELERIDVLIESEDEIVNFLRIVQLEGDKLVLPYGRGTAATEAGWRPSQMTADFLMCPG